METDISPISQSKKDLARIAQILNILVKFRMRSFVEQVLTGERIKVYISEKERKELAKTTPQENARMLLEELGTTFVKFGQILSTREDIVGPDYAEEFSKLQDKMKPFSTEHAKRIIKEELHKSVEELFSSFDSEPIGSASIGQVHRATLKNGNKVVVKIQRPGIEETIKEDLRIMHYLADLVDMYLPEARKYDPKYLVNEFERSITKELNFTREAKNALRLKENFKGVKGIYVPAIYEDMCTQKVLVMEEIKGTKLSEVIKSDSKKFDKRLIARRGANAFFKMVLTDGFYHADLHPGNIMIMNGNVVCFLDFGRMGTVDKDLAESMLLLSRFTLNDDVNGLVAQLTRMGILGDLVDMDSFKADMIDLLDAYHNTRIENVKIGQMLNDFMAVISKYDFNRPREVAELSRSILIIEGTGSALDPKFNAFEEFTPYANKVTSHMFDTKRIVESLGANLLDIEYYARTLPSALRRFTKKLEDGKIKIELEHKDLDTFTADLERIGNKLSIALILAALIVGSSIVISVYKPLGLVGFLISSILALWLVFKILVYKSD